MSSPCKSNPDAEPQSSFGDVKVIDNDWVELTVTTPEEEVVHYRIPRRTNFRRVDRAAEASSSGAN